MKLKIKLWRNENIVCMWVLEQELDRYQFKADRIKTNQSSYLGAGKMWLRGLDKIYDNWISQRSFNNEQEAQEYLDKVISWLDDEFVSNTEPKEGDWVEVTEGDFNEWKKRIFLMKDKSGRILCVWKGYEHLYNNKLPSVYDVSLWADMRPLKQSLYNPETQIWEWEG